MIRSSKSVSTNGRKVVTSSMSFPSIGNAQMGGLNYGFPGSMNVSAIGSGMLNNLDTLLFGLMPQDELSLTRYYRDIYAYDVIAGPAVDLMSTLPFSEFTLEGGTDEDLEPFHRSIKHLRADSLLPDGAKDYLVTGKFCTTLLYDQQKKIFIDTMPHPSENLILTSTPLYTAEPLIELRLDRVLKNFLTSQNPYLTKVRNRIPQNVLKLLLSSDKVALDSLTTVFIPRKENSRSTGVSAYRRVLPWYLLEKLLYRGTLSEATKRQRAIGHITMGNENWDPTDADLQAMAGLWQQADLDPLGAILATRPDVQYSEVRPGGDFWKVTDIQDQLNSLKYKGLGVSDGLLSGEANLNAADTALSVFLDQLRSFRELMTRKFFYEKVFPAIAVIHDKRKKDNVLDDVQDEIDQSDFSHGERNDAQDRQEARVRRMRVQAEEQKKSKDGFRKKTQDTGSLFIPTVRWHKQLRPEADREYMDVLNTLADHGVPITLRAWAAAGGMDLDKMLHELEEDIALRDAIKSLAAESDGGGEGGGSDYDDEGGDGGGDGGGDSAYEDGPPPGSDEGVRADFASVRKVLAAASRRKAKPFLARDFGIRGSEVVGKSKTGKDKYIPNQKRAVQKENEVAARALARLSDRSHFDKTLAKAKGQKTKAK